MSKQVTCIAKKIIIQDYKLTLNLFSSVFRLNLSRVFSAIFVVFTLMFLRNGGLMSLALESAPELDSLETIAFFSVAAILLLSL